MLNYRHIFIVDDDTSILDYYRKIFSPSFDEFDILGGEKNKSGDEVVLQLFAKPVGLLSYFSSAHQSGQRFPLCILDMRMPELNGLETALRLREQDPDINIIICSAYSDATTSVIKQKLDNRVFFVHKPFAPDEFKLLVFSILREWEGKQALRKSEARLLQIIEATRTGIWEWNIETAETILDKRWAKIVGYTLEELGSPTTVDTWAKLTHPDDLKNASGQIEKLLANENSYYDTEFRMRHKDGTWVWVHSRGQVTERNANRKAIRISGTHTDITARKQSEEKLQLETALLLAQTEATIDGILIVDENRKRVLANSKIAELFHVPPHIMKDENDQSLLQHVVQRTKNPEEFLKKVLYLYEHTQETSRDEVEMKSGMLLERYSAPVIGKNGTIFGRIWSFRDITGLRKG
jgi:PAS domain S-box-containing protein